MHNLVFLPPFWMFSFYSPLSFCLILLFYLIPTWPLFFFSLVNRKQSRILQYRFLLFWLIFSPLFRLSVVLFYFLLLVWPSVNLSICLLHVLTKITQRTQPLEYLPLLLPKCLAFLFANITLGKVGRIFRKWDLYFLYSDHSDLILLFLSFILILDSFLIHS